jgi:hypothetical protein
MRPLKRSLEVQCGSNSFILPLDSVPPKKVKSGLSLSGVKGSVPLVMRCATSRGGRVTTNGLPVIQVSWVRHSRGIQDIIVVDGDHFTEAQKFLEQAYGAPDTEIRSPGTIGNGRSLTYTPQQIGAVLNVTADSRQTIVSVMGRQRP